MQNGQVIPPSHLLSLWILCTWSTKSGLESNLVSHIGHFHPFNGLSSLASDDCVSSVNPDSKLNSDAHVVGSQRDISERTSKEVVQFTV